jgi:phenylacetate-coenzyme A ligase PaaK-like adenylate-forming protein
MNFEKRLTKNMRAEAPSLFRPGALTRSDVDRYHLHKLQAALRYVSRNSSFYREIFRKEGISPDDVRTLSDIEKLPLTEPEHVAASPFRFLCLSRSEIARTHNFDTSGTTGPQKKIFWTQNDLNRIVRFLAAGIGTVAGRGDVVNIWLPGGLPYGQSDLLSKGVKKIGAKPVAAPMDISAEEHLRLIRESRVTVIFGSTRRILRLTRELERSHDLSSPGVHTLFLTAEYLPDNARAYLQKIWGCRVSTHYGLTEMGLGVAVECEAGDGCHFNEADLMVEIVDSETGRPVAPGDEGELVFTTLTREEMPLIRYRTRDISRLITEPCSCGAKALGKFATVRKRVDAIIKLAGGAEIYPSIFDEALMDMCGFIDWQAILDRHDGREIMRFRVELNEPDPGKIPEIRKRLLAIPALAKNIQADAMSEPLIEIAAPGELLNTGTRKNLITDLRLRSGSLRKPQDQGLRLRQKCSGGGCPRQNWATASVARTFTGQ